MKDFLEALGKRGAGLLAAGLGVGLVLPPLAEHFRPLLIPAVFALLTVAMTRINLEEVRDFTRSPGRLIGSFAWINLAWPLIAGVAVTLIGIDRLGPGLALAIILIASAPPIISAPALCYLMGLNGTLSLTLLFGSTLLTPFITPLMTGLWIGGDLPLTPWDLGQRLFLLVSGALLVAFIARKKLGREKIESFQGVFDGMNVIFMIIFAIALMDGITERILQDPLRFAGFIVLSFAIALGMMAVTTLLFRTAGRRLALSIGYTTGFRNIALAVGALGSAVPDDTWLMFAVGQFPIYLGPLILRPVCRFMLKNDA